MNAEEVHDKAAVPFEPLGVVARWRMIYAVLVTRAVDDIVTYAELGGLLDLHPVEDRNRISAAMRRAAWEYETENRRAVEAVPNIGYRIVTPPEHLGLAKRQHKKAGRALQRGQSKVVNVDLNGMDPEVRKAFEVTAVAFNGLLDMSRRMFQRQDRLESAVSEIAGKSAKSEEEIAELRARLERIEAIEAVKPEGTGRWTP